MSSPQDAGKGIDNQGKRRRKRTSSASAKRGTFFGTYKPHQALAIELLERAEVKESPKDIVTAACEVATRISKGDLGAAHLLVIQSLDALLIQGFKESCCLDALRMNRFKVSRAEEWLREQGTHVRQSARRLKTVSKGKSSNGDSKKKKTKKEGGIIKAPVLKITNDTVSNSDAFMKIPSGHEGSDQDDIILNPQRPASPGYSSLIQDDESEIKVSSKDLYDELADIDTSIKDENNQVKTRQEIRSLRSKLVTMNQELAQLDAENESLDREANELRGHLKESHTNIKKCIEEMKNLKDVISKRDDHIKKLCENNTFLEERLNSLISKKEKEISELKVKLKHKEEEINTMTKIVSKPSNSNKVDILVENSSDISYSTSEMSMIEKDNARLMDKNKELEHFVSRHNKDIQDKIDEYEAKLAELSNENNSEKSQRLQLENDLCKITDERDMLITANKELEKNNDAHLTNFTCDLACLRNTNTKLEEEIKELRLKLEEKVTELQNSEFQGREQADVISKLREKNSALREQSDICESEKKGLLIELQSMKSKVEDQERSIKKAIEDQLSTAKMEILDKRESEIDSLKLSTTASDIEIKALRAKNSVIEAQRDELRLQLDSLIEDSSDFSPDAEELKRSYRERLKAKDDQLEELRNKYDALGASLLEFKEGNFTLRDEIKFLKEKVSSVSYLEKEVTILVDEKEKLKIIIGDYEDNVASLKKRNQQLEKEIAQSQRAVRMAKDTQDQLYDEEYVRVLKDQIRKLTEAISKTANSPALNRKMDAHKKNKILEARINKIQEDLIMERNRADALEVECKVLRSRSIDEISISSTPPIPISSPPSIVEK